MSVDGSKQGLDDFLVNEGNDALKTLIDEAPNLIKWVISQLEGGNEVEQENALNWLVPRIKAVGDVAVERFVTEVKRQLPVGAPYLRKKFKETRPWKPNPPRADRDEATAQQERTRAERQAGSDQERREEEALVERAIVLASSPSVFHQAINAVGELGVTGEKANIGIIRLAVRSRALKRPANIEVNSPSSSGKTHLIVNVLKLEHPEAYYELTASSEKALIYLDEPLEHKILYIQEPEGLAQGAGAAALKSLIWESRLRYDAVIKDESGQFVVQHVEKNGPTGLIVTTTRPLDEQISNRMWRIEVDSSEEQTKAILQHIAQEAAGFEPNIDVMPWHMMSKMLGEPVDVVVQYAPWLATNVETSTLRIRRDFTQLLAFIKASAIEHRYQRQVREDGVIVATAADYAIVHALAADDFTAAQGEGITKRDREFVAAVKELCKGGKNSVSQADISRRLKASKGAVSYRVRRLLTLGFLQNLESTKGKAAKLILDSPLPEPVPPLPDPCQLSTYLGEMGLNNLVRPWVNPITGEAHNCSQHPETEILPAGIATAEHLNT